MITLRLAYFVLPALALNLLGGCERDYASVYDHRSPNFDSTLDWFPAPSPLPPGGAFDSTVQVGFAFEGIPERDWRRDGHALQCVFSLDGSVPDSLATYLTSPFPLTSSRVLKARMIRPRSHPGHVVTVAFEIRPSAEAAAPVFEAASEWLPLTLRRYGASATVPAPNALAVDTGLSAITIPESPRITTTQYRNARGGILIFEKSISGDSAFITAINQGFLVSAVDSSWEPNRLAAREAARLAAGSAGRLFPPSFPEAGKRAQVFLEGKSIRTPVRVDYGTGLALNLAGDGLLIRPIRGMRFLVGSSARAAAMIRVDSVAAGDSVIFLSARWGKY